MNFEKYANKGLSGLANLGNTCFINSCMQVISHIYELNDFLEEGNYKKKLNNKLDSALLIEWDNLRKLLWNQNCVVSPNKFLKTIQKISQIKGNDVFSGYDQNDVCEFLLFLIDCFHTSVSREINMTIMGNSENETDNIAIKCYEMIKKMYSKEYSEIWNLFYAIHVSEIINLETGKTLTITPEPFFMIDLPIPKNIKCPSLLDCFDLYVEGELLEGENAWFNEETNTKQSVRKKISFWSFPKILVIDLKRFNKNSRYGQKIQKYIDFSFDLNLSKYVIGYKKNSFNYDLFGVCNHGGDVLGGHYTAYVKNANNKWYYYNDTIVSEVSRIETIVSPKAYLLFYRKKV